MFQEPNEKCLIAWAEDSIESAKKQLDKNYYSNAKSYILCAISYLQDAIRKFNEKGA